MILAARAGLLPARVLGFGSAGAIPAPGLAAVAGADAPSLSDA